MLGKYLFNLVIGHHNLGISNFTTLWCSKLHFTDGQTEDEPLILLKELWVQIKGFNALLHKLITICLQDFCITSNSAWRFYQLTYTSWVSIMET